MELLLLIFNIISCSSVARLFTLSNKEKNLFLTMDPETNRLVLRNIKEINDSNLENQFFFKEGRLYLKNKGFLCSIRNSDYPEVCVLGANNVNYSSFDLPSNEVMIINSDRHMCLSLSNSTNMNSDIKFGNCVASKEQKDSVLKLTIEYLDGNKYNGFIEDVPLEILENETTSVTAASSKAVEAH